jgi:STE24 endopeptidase
MANTLFIVILIFMLAEFLLDRILHYLNSTYWSDRLPDELRGIYDPEKYKLSQDYARINQRLSALSSTLSFIALLLMLLLGGFAWLDMLVRALSEHPVIMALLYFGTLVLASTLLSLPFSIYDTFVIEERFGFNKTTVRTFILDLIKSIILGAVVGGGILALFVYLYIATGLYFWLFTWAAVSAFMLFMGMFYSNLIVPLFNKQKPLEAGPLRDAIEDFASKTGFKLKNIYVIDGSKRSSKANAYFTGLGAKKRIVLYDTLIMEHSIPEIVAVLAHETGHYRKKHTTTGMLLSVLQTGLMLFILSLFINMPVLSEAIGARQQSFHMGLTAFGLLYAPLSTGLGLVMNYISRRNEYAADRYAAENYDAEALAAALKKLSVNNLSNLRPHPAYVFFYYSHPPLLKRLAALRKHFV